MTCIYMDVDVALSEVPVNLVPLTDNTDYKTIETAVAYNAAGMALYWHFLTTGGAYSATAVTPTTAGGAYDWTHQQQGMYTIEIPASGGASINNGTKGFGWFTGYADGVLPWTGPRICFRAAALNNALIDGGDELDVNVTKIVDATPTMTNGILRAGLVFGSGTVTDANEAPTSQDFDTTLTDPNFYNYDKQILFTSGALTGEPRCIGSYQNNFGHTTVSEVFAVAPTVSDDFVLIADHTHNANAIGTACWATATRTLTAIDEDSTTLDLDATIRAALGLPAANLGTRLDAINTAVVTDIPATLADIETDIAALLVDTGTDIPALIAAIGTTQMTESYAADGVAPTRDQALFLIMQSLHEFGIVTVSRTVKKLDGTTTAAVFTLDSATTPTSTTRSS